MFQKSIYQKYVCNDVLDDLLNKVVQSTTNKKVQYKLNQLTLLSSPLPPSTGSTVRPVKIKFARSSNAMPPQSKKK